MKRKICLILSALMLLCSCAVTEPAVTDGTSGTNPAASSSVGTTEDGQTTDAPPDTPKERFSTVGYYAFDDASETKCRFYRACGIDTIELLDIGWYFKEGEPLEAFRKRMKDWITTAHENGLKVYVVLLTNIEQWTGEGDFGNGSGKTFDPDDAAMMTARLEQIERNVAYWSDADGFSLFAGDPGGVATLKNKGSIDYYLDMVKKVREIVRQHSPEAEFNANIWSVSQWVKGSSNPFYQKFWEAEDENGRAILNMEDIINSDIGIEIPGHDWYRPLAFRCYQTTGRYPEKNFPSKEDITPAKERGVERIWGFAHFLLDELDDGDAGGTSRTTLPSINLRYIKKYIDAMGDAGMNGVIAGTCSMNNALNLYAFARFAADAELTEDDVLCEYAGYLVPEEQVKTLADIFRYIEHDSNWHAKMPEDYRLPEYDTGFSSPAEAAAALESLTPLENSSFPLPETPAEYLAKLGQRIALIGK